MSKPVLVSRNSAAHYLWGNNCDSWIVIETPGLSVKQERMPPGTSERKHLHHRSLQVFLVSKGMATFYCGEKMFSVSPPESFIIPAQQPHYIANEQDHDLEFTVISQPSTKGDRVDFE